MKATDLMIGDWVKCTDPRCEGHQVDLIDHGNEEVGLDGEIDNFENIIPIPLTPEILEQNGFVLIRQNAVEPYYWQYFDKKDGSIVNAFRRIYRGLWIECSNATTEASTNKQCEFVHELQHAIKNTEIEMEVVVC